jgi:hypothetical protein
MMSSATGFQRDTRLTVPSFVPTPELAAVSQGSAAMEESGLMVALAHIGKFLLRRVKLLIVGAHNLRDQEVEGSNPFAPTTSNVFWCSRKD